MDKMREEFEAWCCKRGYTLKPAETNCGIIIEGAYGHPRVQLAWESWQESRSALCVELPKITDFAKDSRGAREVLNFEFAVECVARELNDVGVRYE